MGTPGTTRALLALALAGHLAACASPVGISTADPRAVHHYLTRNALTDEADGVESELIVPSPHSGMQAAPQTIEEVRRIFLEHSAKSACPMPPAGKG